MANLYEINEQILSCVDMETGEIIDADKLQDLQLAFPQKRLTETNYINLCVRFVTGTMYNLSFVKRKILGTKSSGY